jgi:hypothetical protein
MSDIHQWCALSDWLLLVQRSERPFWCCKEQQQTIDY